ncbi:hypothetical protein HPB47_024152 [Ixodes persulcatus]|uniref:Uncharacterized protein n=1 Tax=Ixodes persulcatus TaxID=34615 RepID=A0AC60Q5F3_IXOPE|nr:hypothetical protein HPB47_024152 [Ixodes persulcatus]
MAKLSGYRACGKDTKEKTRVTTPVRRNLPVIEHDTGISTVEHVLIEIKSNTKRDGRSVFMLNVYSSPAKRHRFAALFRATLEIAKQQALVVVGVFNAPHPDLGYLMETEGRCKAQDTMPDLAFVRYVKGAEWINTWEDLGRDHFVAAAYGHSRPGETEGGFLEKFEEDDIDNIEEWTEELRACVEHVTKTVPDEENVLTADSKLLRMWEAKASRQRRLRIQRHSRNLRRKIAKLTKETEAHANKITRQQWQDSCDGFVHQLGAPKTWNILRHLLDPDGTKTAQKNKMSEILDNISRHLAPVPVISWVSNGSERKKHDREQERKRMRKALGVAEKSKLECIVRKACKRALGHPDSTSNEKLATLGVHNTIDELIEAQRTAQLERLMRSATGRHIFKSLGLRYETQRGEKVDVPLHIRELLQISPIPKHMDPVHDTKRREARAKALGRTLKEEEGVAYVDVAEYKGRGAMAAAVVNGDGHHVAS